MTPSQPHKLKIAAAETREEWGRLAGTDKAQEELGGGRDVGR